MFKVFPFLFVVVVVVVVVLFLVLVLVVVVILVVVATLPLTCHSVVTMAYGCHRFFRQPIRRRGRGWTLASTC